MPIIDQIKAICDRLAPLGWRDLLKTVTGGALNIKQASATALHTELTKNLPAINRAMVGFEDFSSAGQRAAEAGQPSLSLLYHALASPLVMRDPQAAPLGGFATPAELDAVENFIFSLAPLNLAQFITQNGGAKKVALVVFSTDYRNASDTVDGLHADLTFSRTGIARVGTARPQYLPAARSFWPEDADNPHNLRVLPARFSAWIAVRKKGSGTRVSPILDNDDAQQSGEAARDFWVPVHKLFSGTECLVGKTLDVQFGAALFNLKIQRIHRLIGTTPLPSGFPYVIRDAEIGALSTDADFGPGWLVPKVRPSLVEPATVNGKPVTYTVKRAKVDPFAAFEGGNGSPEYVHARTRVSNGILEDLNDQPDVVAAMKSKPSYEALHYIDYTGDGWITSQVQGLAQPNMKAIPAYVLVSAPDFFPSAGQFELSEWSRSALIPGKFRDKLWSIKPTPLSETRMPANLQLPGSPFKAADTTITAVVGMGAPAALPAMWPVKDGPPRATSLPDDAAGIFAPGWDVSTDQNATNVTHLAAYSLGSPFPEDAKLCAALSTFWPAVAPDVFRTFVHVLGNTNGTIAPLTDEEIGQSGTLPLDGIAGPKVITVGGHPFVEFPAFLNADYVRQAVENRLTLRITSRITSGEYESRMIAACRTYSVLANRGDIIAERNKWLMLSFREVASGDPGLQTAQAEAGTVLQGKVYAVRFCRLATPVSPKTDPRVERMPLVDDRACYASAQSVMVLIKKATDTRFAASPSE